MWSNGNSHLLLAGMQNAAATLEGSLEVSYKTKHTLIVRSNNCIPWYLPKGVENLCFQQKPLQLLQTVWFEL